jgi:hypothetical protein
MAAACRRGPWRAALWLSLLLGAGAAQAARIEVSLDRNPVARNESFNIIFTADAMPDGEPDTGPLEENFEILGKSQSSQFAFNNGRSSRSIEWRLTVMARKEGTLEIPPIAFGSDRSEAFAVTVQPARSVRSEPGGADIFAEVEAEPRNPYVQAQVVYTLRIYTNVRAGVEVGKPETDDAPVIKLDGDRQYATTRNGVRYQVDERRYAIFPQKSGPFRIPPVQLEAQVMAAGGGSLFGQFFSRPVRTERLESDAIELEVRPIPHGFQGKHWLPAAGLELADGFDGNAGAMVAGEPLTRTLMVKAEGATLGVVPELERIGPALPAEFKQYPDQPVVKETRSPEGVTALRQEKAALIGTQPGTYRLPAIEVPWWNTRTDQPEVARIPERTLTVLAAAHGGATKTPEPAPESTPAPPVAGPEAPPPVPPAADAGPWRWLALALGLGWLATALGWWWHSRHRPTTGPVAPPPPAVPSDAGLVTALEQACRAHDPAAARRALAAWGDRHWPGTPMVQWARNADAHFGHEVAALDRALYGSPGRAWQGEALWANFQAVRHRAAGPRKTGETPQLEPLYKF